MSNVIISSYDKADHVVHYDSGASAVGVARPVAGFTMSDVRPISSAPFINRSKTDTELRNFVVTRKLKGYIAENRGDNWRVMFVVEGIEIAYDLPAQELVRAGIKARYQPFEMDELRPISPHVSGKVYRFRPLAAAKDAYIETLPLDEERERKYQLILGRLGKS